MSRIINLPNGISTVGNPTNNNVLISNIDTTNILSLKTLVNGQWKSWTSGTPEEFQGFLSVNKGKGFVVRTNAITNITFDDTILDINTLEYNIGLDMLSLPYDNRIIGDGYIPRLKFNSIKTIDNSIWKSWTKGTPSNFQGFSNTDINKGYVVDVETTFGSFINIDSQDNSEGVRFNLSSGSLNNNSVIGGVSYTNPNNLGTFNFDIIEFDPTNPTVIMFFSIDNKIAKIDFPVELTNKQFLVSYNGVIYKGLFTENENYSTPLIITETINNDSLELTYVPKNTLNNIYKEMILNVDNVKSIIEFDTTYINEVLTVWKDGKILTTNFTEGEVILTFS